MAGLHHDGLAHEGTVQHRSVVWGCTPSPHTPPTASITVTAVAGHSAGAGVGWWPPAAAATHSPCRAASHCCRDADSSLVLVVSSPQTKT